MKELKSFVKIINIGFIFIIILLIAILVLISANIKADLLVHKPPSESEILDSIIVHFIHGSIPKNNCDYKKKRLGSYLGGHVEIEVNDKVFGFLYDSIPINFIPKNTFNSRFEVKEKIDWKKYTGNDKITSIYIPVTYLEIKQIESLLNKYVKTVPYDYAFWGQRCTSSTAKILSDVGIINKFSNLEAIIAFFYPRALRFTLLQFAKKNNFKVVLKPGIDCHKWE